MPTPKKTNSKTVAKEVPAPKKKTCGKSGCKTAVDLEAPAKKKCCGSHCRRQGGTGRQS